MAAGANCSTNPMTHRVSMLSSSYFQNELLKHLLLAYTTLENSVLKLILLFFLPSFWSSLQYTVKYEIGFQICLLKNLKEKLKQFHLKKKNHSQAQQEKHISRTLPTPPEYISRK